MKSTICRRVFLGRTAFLAVLTVATAAVRRTAGAQMKISQERARYQGQPNGGKKCGDCRHFIADQGACRLVEGRISPNGWCTLWAAKT